VRGHVAIITETESTYVMVESTLRFDDVKMYQAFSGRFKGHVCGQENGAGDGLGTRLVLFCYAEIFSLFCFNLHVGLSIVHPVPKSVTFYTVLKDFVFIILSS